MMNERMDEKVRQLKGRLIVSCQALPEEPLHSSFIMGRMALAAKEGGAGGIRAAIGDLKESEGVFPLHRGGESAMIIETDPLAAVVRSGAGGRMKIIPG